jgi:hypothetical protein
MVATATAEHGCHGLLHPTLWFERAHLKACQRLVVSTTHSLGDAAALDAAAVDAADAKRTAVASMLLEGVPMHPLSEAPCQDLAQTWYKSWPQTPQ